MRTLHTLFVPLLVCSSALAVHADPPTSKGGSSWKLPPSTSQPSKSAPPDSQQPDSLEGVPSAQAIALVDAARAQRVDAARAGTVGPWNDSVRLYCAQSTELSAPAVFHGVSSPTLIALSPEAVALFVVNYSLDTPRAFGTLARATSSNRGVDWSELQPCLVDGIPVGMDFPEHPCVCSASAGRLRLYFVARNYAHEPPTRHLLSALSSDGGVTWSVETSKVVDLRDRVAETFAVCDLSAATLGPSTHLFLALSDSAEPVIHAAAMAEGIPVLRPRLAVGGSWMGSATASKSHIAFTSIASKAGELVRSTSRNGRDWKAESIEAAERPPTSDEIDVAYLFDDAVRRHYFALVTRDLHPHATEPIATSPPSGSTPEGSEEVPAIAPTGRRSSDPIAAPRGLEALPLGGKKPPPATPQPGPVAPGLGNP